MLVYVTRKFPPRIGGMETAGFHLSRELGRHLPVRLIGWGGSQKLLPLFFFKTVAEFRHLARSRAPVSLVYFGDVLSAVGVRIARPLFPDVPMVATAHGLDVIYPPRPYQWTVGKVLRDLDHVICDSERTRGDCLERGASPDRCTVIPLGAEMRHRDAIDPNKRIHARHDLAARICVCADERPILLTVGRLIRRKGVAWFVGEVLPLVLSQQPDTLYVVAGQGPERERILDLARAAGVAGHIRLLGEVDDTTRDLLYESADVFVMPNIPVPGDVEGFGLVAIEASAAGLWVAASAVDGIVEAVANATGDLLPPLSADVWARRLGELLSDRCHCFDLGASAQRFVEGNLSWPAVASRYLQLFRGVQRSTSGQRIGWQ